LVLPREAGGLERFEKAFQDRLKSQQWVTTWLTQRDPAVLDHIFRKEVAEGMTWVDVVAALGEPRNAAERESQTMEFTADYGDLLVTVTGNIVKKVVSHKAEAAIAQRKAQEAAEQARVEAEKRRAEDETRRLAADEARKKAEEEATKVRADAMAKADAERQADIARKEQERQKLAVEEERLKKEADLKARMDEAQRIKQAALSEKERLKQEAELAKQVAKAEAEAKLALKKADAEAAAQKKKYDKQVVQADAEAQKAKKKAESVEALAQGVRAKADLLRQDIARASTETEGPRKIGAKVQPLSPQLAGALGLPNTSGAFIAEVATEGDGARAGFKANDIVLTVDGKEVVDPKSFVELVAGVEKSRAVALEVLRSGKRTALSLPAAATAAVIEKQQKELTKLEVDAAAKEQAAVAARTDAEAKARAVAKLRRDYLTSIKAEPRQVGIRVEPLGAQLAQTLAATAGGPYVVDVVPGSAAALAGVERADVIVRVNGVPVSSPEELAAVAGYTLPSESLDVELLRKGARFAVRVAGDPKALPKIDAAVVPTLVTPVTPVQPAGKAPVASAPQPVRGGRAAPDPRASDLGATEAAENVSETGRRPVQ